MVPKVIAPKTIGTVVFGESVILDIPNLFVGRALLSFVEMLGCGRRQDLGVEARRDNKAYFT